MKFILLSILFSILFFDRSQGCLLRSLSSRIGACFGRNVRTLDDSDKTNDKFSLPPGKNATLRDFLEYERHRDQKLKSRESLFQSNTFAESSRKATITGKSSPDNNNLGINQGFGSYPNRLYSSESRYNLPVKKSRADNINQQISRNQRTPKTSVEKAETKKNIQLRIHLLDNRIRFLENFIRENNRKQKTNKIKAELAYTNAQIQLLENYARGIQVRQSYSHSAAYGMNPVAV